MDTTMSGREFWPDPLCAGLYIFDRNHKIHNRFKGNRAAKGGNVSSSNMTQSCNSTETNNDGVYIFFSNEAI